MEEVETGNYLIDFQFIEKPIYFGGIRLYQVGKKFCDWNTVVLPHAHVNWFELTVILEGKGRVYVGHDFAPVDEGDIFLSFPCDIHKIESDAEKPLKYSFLSFCLENEDLKEEFNAVTERFFECEKRVFRDRNLLTLIDLLITEIAAEGFQKERVVSCLLQQILIFTCRAFLHGQTENVPDSASSHEILCYKIMRYIDNNLFALGNLTEVSNFFNYNYSYLAKIFKRTTNSTLAQYLAGKKLERAKVLIDEGKLSFSAIAALLRYASIYSFSKSFKRRFGLSPSEYKNRRHKK